MTNTVILVVSASENVAKRIESHLRNAGYPVRAAWVTDLEDVEDVLGRSPPDLLLCSDNLEKAPLKAVVELGNRLCPDVPVLLLSERYSEAATLQALAAGAHDQVSCEDARHMRHLELICLRELANHQNLRELHAARSRLSDFESRHKALLAGSVDAVAHLQEGILADANPAFAQLLGYANQDELVSQPLMDFIAPESQAQIKDLLKQINKGKAAGKETEFSLQRQDGSAVSVKGEFAQNRINGEMFIELTIHADARLPGASAGQAGEAPSGRLAFQDRLTEALATPRKQLGAALMIAIDNLSGFEERLGFHDSEEAVLKLIEWTRERLQPQDQLFRVSTGELALLMERASVDDYEKFSEAYCRDCAKQIFATLNHEAQISVSIAAYPYSGKEQAGTMVDELWRGVRKLTASGGRQHTVLGPTAKNSISEREEAARAEQIRKALQDNRMRLAYQSIASLEGDTRQHYDVLLRMIDEQGREHPAGDFVRHAEKFGLMGDLDRWVTARVLKLIDKRKGADEGSSVFVKVSEDTLKNADAFITWLTDAVKSRPLKADELVFEFQELRLQNHIRKAKSMTKALRELGAYIAIEHFGAGTNTVQLLDHIPANYVKFHADFTHKFNDKDMFKKMSQLLEAAKQHGMKTIVCHVEDANVMARLWQMGVNYIQGFHVQEPEVVMISSDGHRL